MGRHRRQTLYITVPKYLYSPAYAGGYLGPIPNGRITAARHNVTWKIVRVQLD